MSERRRATRVIRQLPLTIADRAGVFTTRTENLSASGACCTVKRFLPLLTKLQIRLELLDTKPMSITCVGIVVRVEPPQPGPKRSGYKVAIFFNDLSAPSRTALARYVQQHRSGATTHS